MGLGISSCGCWGSCRASGGVSMRTVLNGECDGSGVMHKGGVGIMGGVGACRNATAAGGVARDNGKSDVGGALVCGVKSCGAVWPMWTTGGF